MTKKLQSKGAAKLFCVLALSLSVVCIAVRLLALLFAFDIDIGYYQRGNILGTLANLLPAVCAASAAAFSFISSIRPRVNTPESCLGVRICSAALCAVFLFTLALSAEMIIYGGFGWKAIITVVCYILSAVFFLLTVLNKKTDTALYVICGTAVIVWLVLALSESYFDSFVQMNSPIKLSFQFAILSAMLLTVTEIRCPFNDSRKYTHLFSAAVAAIFCGTSAIPSIICYLLGKMPDTYYLFAYDCVLCLFFALAIARLIQLCFGADRATTIATAPEGNELTVETTDSVDSDGGGL